MQCAQCNTSFPDPVWPATRQLYCSLRCGQAAWRTKHRELVNLRSREWTVHNRERRLANQRKWNNSPKGLESKRRWHEKNISRRCREYLAQYHAEEAVRKLQWTRAKSRKKLIRSGVEMKCYKCSSPPPKLHCHHKDLDPFNQDLTNLEWLCFRCHAFVHSEAGRIE